LIRTLEPQREAKPHTAVGHEPPKLDEDLIILEEFSAGEESDGEKDEADPDPGELAEWNALLVSNDLVGRRNFVK